MMTYIYTIIIILTLTYVLDKLKTKFLPDEELGYNDLINKHLLGHNGVSDNRPIIWVHREHSKNDIRADRFNSRKNKNINKAYINCCLESILKNCGESFRICIIDDNSFKTLLPTWKISINDFGDPIKKHIRYLAMAKLLYKYGGMQIPESTLVLKDLNALYNDNISIKGCFIGNKLSKCKDGNIPISPDNNILACKKDCSVIGDYICYLEQLNSTDHSDNIRFNCKIEHYFSKRIFENKITNIDGEYFGIKDKDGNKVSLDDLMEEKFIDFHENIFAISIPNKELLSRTQYGWFLRLPKEQLLESPNILSKHLLLSQNS